MPNINTILNAAFKPYLAALLFAAGLILASSAGPLFPWPNLAGVGIMFGGVAVARGVES